MPRICGRDGQAAGRISGSMLPRRHNRVPQYAAPMSAVLHLSAQPAVPGLPRPGGDVVRGDGVLARDRLGGELARRQPQLLR
jgi:hypothetical protein